MDSCPCEQPSLLMSLTGCSETRALSRWELPEVSQHGLPHLAGTNGQFLGVFEQCEFGAIEGIPRATGVQCGFDVIGTGLIIDEMAGVGPVICE